MENSLISAPEPRTEAEAQAVIGRLFAEMKALNDAMKLDQKQIESMEEDAKRLRLETRDTLSRIQTLV